MSEQQKQLLIEQHRALKAQAKAYDDLSSALKMEATILLKMTKLDSLEENR